MRYILHITTRSAWGNAQLVGHYDGDTLSSEGFIHCSNPDQVVTVANARFRTQRDLVVLGIDRTRVTATIQDENLEGGSTLFPHIYGPLNIDSVVAVFDLAPTANGRFALPNALKSDYRFTPVC